MPSYDYDKLSVPLHYAVPVESRHHPYQRFGDDRIAVTAPLALRRRSAIDVAPLAQSVAPFFQFGARTAVQTASGTVATIFALLSYDRRQKAALYSLRVVNSTNAPAACRVWAVGGDGSASLAYPLPIEVGPFSIQTAEVAIFPKDYRSFERAVVEVIGEGIHCAVEAAAPVTQRKYNGAVLLAVATLAAALVATVTAICYFSLPRISAFVAPPTAATGTTVDAEYTASGIGKLSYFVEGPDGRRTQQGTLSDRSGEIPVAIAASDAPGAYTVRLTMAGPFTSDREVRVLNAVPPKVVNRGAQITDISVTPIVAKPGQAITVAYSAVGESGFVRLLGMDGTVWSQKAFSSSGSTQLTVPPVASSREMRVLLHVTKGRSAAESSAGLVVNVADAPPTVAATQSAPTDNSTSSTNSDPPQAATDPNANGTFQLLSGRAKSGGSIHVQIISPRNGMRISLMDTQSHEITGVNVGSDAQGVTLKAPAVQLATRYIVQASFVDGFGQESIVEPVTVSP